MRGTVQKLSVLLLILALFLCACGSKKSSADDSAPTGIADAIAISQSELPALTEQSFGSDGFANYIARYYQLSIDAIEDGVVRFASGVDAREIAVLRFQDPAAAETARKQLDTYIRLRAGDFYGYAPEQAEIAERGRAVRSGVYAALLILPNPDAAEQAFLAALGAPAAEAVTSSKSSASPPPSPLPEPDASPSPAPEPSLTPEPVHTPELIVEESPSGPEPTPEPAPTPAQDVYDHDAVLDAWLTGNDSALSPKNLVILNSASAVLVETLTEDMTLYEKELALHDWMLAHGQFDYYNVSHHPDDEPGPDNENPYGFFVLGKGVCYGYASTFQLLMDMAGVECRTVNGLAGSERATHAWNMVRLDGEWYFVDVSWNDPAVSYPISSQQAHQYFNVTGEYLRSERHFWDDDAVPEASGTDYAWKQS